LRNSSRCDFNDTSSIESQFAPIDNSSYSLLGR
jgi:hypothetical protein